MVPLGPPSTRSAPVETDATSCLTKGTGCHFRWGQQDSINLLYKKGCLNHTEVMAAVYLATVVGPKTVASTLKRGQHLGHGYSAGSQQPPSLAPSMNTRGHYYCHFCWRVERHRYVPAPRLAIWTLGALTLGIALVFWPYRCECCGRVRFGFVRFSKRERARKKTNSPSSDRF